MLIVNNTSVLNVNKNNSLTPELATVTTSVINVYQTGGDITNGGGSTISARGVCWGTSANPTVANEHTTNGSGVGSFTSTMNNLNNSTHYYVRAYATNSSGTAYGNQREIDVVYGTIDLTSAVGTDAQTKCIGTAITNITYATSGATGATVTGLVAGVTGQWAANVFTISGTATAAGSPFNYTVTLTGGYGPVTINGSLNVTPNNTLQRTSATDTDAQTVQVNTPITNITYATTGATGATVTGRPVGVNASWVANVVTISGTPTQTGSFTYTITLTGGCGVITTTGNIYVNS